MKSLILGSLCCAVICTMTGCAGLVGGAAGNGYLPSPIVLNHSFSNSAIDNDVKWTKSGTSKATGIICFSEGDATITAAMKAGNIKKVHHVDYTVKNILGIIAETTVTVYGE